MAMIFLAFLFCLPIKNKSYKILENNLFLFRKAGEKSVIPDLHINPNLIQFKKMIAQKLKIGTVITGIFLGTLLKLSPDELNVF